MSRHIRKMGMVTRGSLIEGIEMRLSEEQSVEDIKAGKFVVVEGEKNEFFSLITDLRLDATNPEILATPPCQEELLLQRVLSGTGTYATVSLRPMLMLSKGEGLGSEEQEPQPVKTIPAHFSTVYEAAEQDVSRIFGAELQGDRFFNIGTPLDMETPVCLNLERFVERSNGIFGKTGTGKTFLTRLILCGLIAKRKAVNLIFDAHSEYGWESLREAGQGRGGRVKGLRQLFGGRVAVFSLDPETTRKRGVKPDVEVYLSYDQIRVEDIALIQEELRLNPTAVDSANLIALKHSDDWLEALLSCPGEEEIKELAEKVGAHPGSLSALWRKLKKLKKLPFLRPDRRGGEDVVRQIMNYIRRGIHIVLEFGRQRDMLSYLLVASVLTRCIYELYVDWTEKYLATNDPTDRPQQLVITVEEAHRFLNPAAARQTAFGTIAREMRKYFVSLLIVDQRPSGIDDEVLSQIGTRIIALLNDEKDIQAVLTGVSNSSSLRAVLASLDSKQQALVIGHAVPMPVVIRTRDYDAAFYRDMGMLEGSEGKEKIQLEVEALFGGGKR